jgi:hypothetical protein
MYIQQLFHLLFILNCGHTLMKEHYIIIIWFVRLLPLRPIVPDSGDSEDDCGEADGT